MQRSERATVAKQTLEIIERGGYVAPNGRPVDLSAAIAAAKDGSKLYSAEVLNLPVSQQGRATKISVTAETTCEAIARLASSTSGHLGALNFASARNPGGGFLGGAQAQEEAVTRSSALYPCLLTQMEHYDRNRAQSSLLYLDLAIYSPQVPFFRNDEGALLDEPALCSVITAAAPNAGAVRDNQPERVGDIEPALRRRAEMVLAIAVAVQIQHLILGAWGCGVFRNDPAQVARAFADLLRPEGRFANVFGEVVFAIHDRTAGRTTLGAFEAQFAPADPSREAP